MQKYIMCTELGGQPKYRHLASTLLNLCAATASTIVVRLENIYKRHIYSDKVACGWILFADI